MKKTVSFGDIWFLAVSTAKHLEEVNGRTDLKKVKNICGYINDDIEDMNFEAFKSAFYRARRQFKKITLTVTD